MFDLKIQGIEVELVTARLTMDSSRQVGEGINLTGGDLM